MKVKYLLAWYEIMGKTEDDVEFEGNTLRDLLESLFKKYGPNFKNKILDEKTKEIRKAAPTTERRRLVSPYRGIVRPEVPFPGVTILVNGLPTYFTGDLKTILMNGDTVTII